MTTEAQVLQETENSTDAACAHCGEVCRKSSMTEVSEKFYCEKCLDEHFRYCSGCEVYVRSDRAYYSELHDRDYCESCFSERVASCSECRDQINPDSCFRNEDGDMFCDDCWSNREGRTPRYQEFSGGVFNMCRSMRKYGIEIEAMMEEDADHLPSERLGSWQQVTDGSLGDNGREYVSPILQGDEGFQEIKKFTGGLLGWGYFVNRSCGLHVHIDGRDLGCAEIKKLLKITRYFEPVLYAMLPESRHEGSYSVPLERFPKSRFRIGAKDEEALKRLWYGPKGSRKVDLKSKYHHSRYYGLNIHSWFYRRSLEFRYHSGTLSSLKITNFIVICQAMVDKAQEIKQVRMPQPGAFSDLLELFVPFLGLTPEIARYVRERVQKFHPERLLVPAA
ncbi:MAG: amidoligase family protein [Candidatus Omnitrophota bacterium]